LINHFLRCVRSLSAPWEAHLSFDPPKAWTGAPLNYFHFARGILYQKEVTDLRAFPGQSAQETGEITR